MNVKDASLKNIGNAIKNAASDLLTNSDFISRTIGMTASYDDIMFIVQALGREPISLLGKDYPFIFDHVRRNFQQGVSIPSMMYGGGEYGCAKFTFYKDPPTVRFADPYQDLLNLLDRWTPNMKFESTKSEQVNKFYAESNDGETNNKSIGQVSSNMGVASGRYSTSFNNLKTCDLIKKTNDNFNHGKFKTLISRFHTNSMDSRDQEDSTQTAFTNKYGMSHGRNLLKITPKEENGYNNPYCRVWTHHYQYHTLKDVIRPFGDIVSERGYEKLEFGDKYYGKGGFRTVGDAESDGFDGGSTRLDKHGVLNYRNGFVNIAPTAKIKDYFESKQDDKDVVSTKKCMFSIENLAWKDTNANNKEYSENGLSPEQRGPLGGRIMWFPPYDLTFSEDVRVDWNGNKFIGRGEQIYTYTNTDRTGNLSFTLLIDHPSILDYWTGHQRNGQSNMSNALISGNDGGVDEIWNQENTLLRFFAGCQVLTAKPQDFYHRDDDVNNEGNGDPTLEPEVTAPDETPSVKTKTIQAVLYYPNNYSGVDDNGKDINPIYYLMNGIGTQMRYNQVTKKSEDFAADVEHLVYSDSGSGFGGYEMKSGKGISIVKQPLTGDTDVEITNAVMKTYAGDTNYQYITDANGDKVRAYYDGGEPAFGAEDITKIVGDKALSKSLAKGANLIGPNHVWYRRRYYYRVDKAYQNQEFSRPSSYIDGTSTQLNSLGFANIRKHIKPVEVFGIKDDSEDYKLISFADLFTAFEGKKAGIIEKNNGVASPLYNEDNVNLVKEIFSNKEKYTNIKIKFSGHAAYQGYSEENKKLARNRGETIKYWITNRQLGDRVQINGEVEIKNQSTKSQINVGKQDEECNKVWRSASMIIEYDETTSSNAVETKATKDVDKVEIPNGQQSQNWSNTASTTDLSNSILANNRIDLSTGKLVPKEDNVKDKQLDKNKSYTTDTVKRYDNEGEFFELLDREAPFLHNLITEKIRYFDPAYHSISPEGFNARLTFLHQCTRQGATIEAGSTGEISAYNLAFGRPPICVLRIGDFYYTKIIINSLNIQYENPQWDLNPEGIGVMPMFAKVSINFTFLGGSDLAGPIARLQNAVSFNYYANASVYDNRAEMVEYEDNASGKVSKFKGYVYPQVTTVEESIKKETVKVEEKETPSIFMQTSEDGKTWDGTTFYSESSKIKLDTLKMKNDIEFGRKLAMPKLGLDTKPKKIGFNFNGF